MARSTALLRSNIRNRQPSRGVITGARSRALTPAASAGSVPRQRPTHNITRAIERQRPVAQMPPTKQASAHIPPRPSSPPERTYRIPYAGKTPPKFRPRNK